MSNSPTIPTLPDAQPAAPVAPPALPPDSAMPNLPAPTPATPTQPSRWSRVLRGALLGLAEGGIPGAVEGAIDPSIPYAARDAARQEQQNELDFQKSRIRFQDAEAAKSISQAYSMNAQLSRMPEEMREKIDSHQLKVAEFFGNSGLTPSLIVEDSPAAVNAAAEQLTRTHNGIPPVTALHVAGKVALYTASDPSQSIDFVNRTRSVQGMPPLTPEQWKALGAKAQESAIHDAAGLWYPQGVTLQTAETEYQRRKLISENYARVTSDVEGAPNYDPNRAENLSTLKSAAQSIRDTANGITAANLGVKRREADITANAKAKAAKADSNMYVGSLPTGEQVAGTSEDLAAAGAAGVTKLPSDEQKKVVVARQMIAPNGLFHAVAADIATLEKEGKIGVVASRWNDFVAGKVGTEPEFASLRANMGLLSTALMQAHVGARGSEQMLEHFKALADYRVADAATLRKALGAEFNYVHEKAMLPKGGK